MENEVLVPYEITYFWPFSFCVLISITKDGRWKHRLQYLKNLWREKDKWTQWITKEVRRVMYEFLYVRESSFSYQRPTTLDWETNLFKVSRVTVSLPLIKKKSFWVGFNSFVSFVLDWFLYYLLSTSIQKNQIQIIKIKLVLFIGLLS